VRVQRGGSGPTRRSGATSRALAFQGQKRFGLALFN
jgi:hypothetical protein